MTVNTYALVAASLGSGVIGFRSGTGGSLTPGTFDGDVVLRVEHDPAGLPALLVRITGTVLQDAFQSVKITNSLIGEVTFLAAQATFTTVGSDTQWAWPTSALFAAAGTYNVEIDTGIGYNCECDDTTDYQTLAVLRARLMVRLGYAGQVNNPPPGMAALLSDFLQSSQRLLYMKYTELRTERFFTWTMEAGTRLYDLPDNDESCTKELNALKLSWAGVEDLNGAWYELASGIPPEFYTGITMDSIPQRYEIRQCIEVFPVPDAAYKLRIKGHYKLQAFTADGDQTTIDSELVFLWALATAKAHYGHPDANNIAAMANDYLGRLVGGKHGTKRYIPGTSPVLPVVRPVMRDGYDA
jgi:hypothetical protein